MGQLLKFIGIRGFAFFIGLGFLLVLMIGFIKDFGTVLNPPEETAEHALYKYPEPVSFANDGFLGGMFRRYDDAQLQRGFQVFKEACSSCHSMQYLTFRDLEDIGYSEDQVKVIASQWPIETPTIAENGEDTTRPPIPSDIFPPVYANEQAARAANNNAYPPDSSLITKARSGGAPYIYSLLTGYQEPYVGYDEPAAELAERFPEAAPGEGLYHNPYFKNLNIAMPPPLTSDGQVSYGEGSPEPTIAQMSLDVAAFLEWAAEPKADVRKNAGIATLIFLAFATAFAYMAYRQIWADAKRKVVAKGPLDPANMAEREETKAEAAAAGRGVKG